MRNKKKNNVTMSWIWEVSGKKKINIGFLLLVQMALGISSVALAWILRGVIDHAVAKDEHGFFTYAVLLIVLVVFQIFLRAVNRFLEEYTKSTMENRFKERLFFSLIHRDYASVTAVHSGEWMNRLTSDTVVVSEGLSLIVPNVAGMLVKMVGALVLILMLVPRFAYILILGGLFLIFLTYTFRKMLKKLHKQVQEADGRLRVFFQERLGSLLIVRSFASEQQTMEEAVCRMSEHKKARMRRNHFSNICNIGFGGVMRGAYVLGAVCCGYGILVETVSYGAFIAVLQLINQIQSPFVNITGYLPKYYAMTASAERLMEAESYTEDCQNKVIDIQEIHKFYIKDFSLMGLEDAAFTYFPSEENGECFAKVNMPVGIKNINLEIRKGEYVAFTGTSGCGKSTILKLLMCLYPLDRGKRYLLGIDGKRVPLISSYRCLFAYVPQGNHLMSGTIREIISFSNHDRIQDEKAIWQSLTIACADECVKKLKDGIDTLLGEGGMGLSEGQMQRIAIARAVFSNHPILMLDESTSALDEQTEKRLLANLRSMTNKTVLIVTHRPEVLTICDRQIIMSHNGIEIKEKEKKVYVRK